MLVIRLTRVGKKNSPAYRVVVAEKRKAVKRQYIEILGHYNPIRKPKEIVIGKDRALFWLERGAKASDTVKNLMVDMGILPENQKATRKYAKKKAEEPKNEKIKEQETSTEQVKNDQEIKEDAEGAEVESEATKQVEAVNETEAENIEAESN